MKNRIYFLLIFTTFVLLSINSAYGQCDDTGKAMAANTQGAWKFYPSNYPKWEAMLKPLLAEMQRVFPQPPKGLKLTYGVASRMDIYSAKPSDVQRYDARFGIFDIYCVNQNGVQKAKEADATGNWIKFLVNDFDGILGSYGGYQEMYLGDLPIYVAGDIQIRENPNGIKSIYFFNRNNEQFFAGWYFSNSKTLPYRRLSKAELAQAYRQYWVKKLNENIQSLEKSIAASEQSIKDVTTLQSKMTEKQKQEVIAAIRKGDQVAKNNIELFKSRIQDCIRRTDAMMNAPDAKSDAFVNLINHLIYEPEMLEPKDGKGNYVYVENRAIYDQKLPKTQPQFVTAWLDRHESTRQKMDFNKKFEDEFDFNVIRKMVGMQPMPKSPTIANMGSSPGNYTSGKIENGKTEEPSGVMFSENFANSTVGQAPTKWTVSNNTAIVKNNTGQAGNWLAMKKEGLFFPDYSILVLPKDFTMEFDLSWNKDISYYSPNFVFHIGAAPYDNTLKRYDRALVNINAYTSAPMNRVELWIDPHWNSNGYFGLETYNSQGGFLKNKRDKTPIFYKDKNKVKVKLMRKGSMLSLYFNDTKVMEEAYLDENIRWNFFGFGLWGGVNALESDEFYLSNIRLSK